MSSGYSKSGLSEWIITFKPWLLPRIQGRIEYIQYWTWGTQPRGWRTVFCRTVYLLGYISWGWGASTLIGSNRQRVLSVCIVALQDSDSTGVFTCPQGQCHNTHPSRYCMRFIVFANLAACLIWDFDELELCQSVSQILFWGCRVSLRHVPFTITLSMSTDVI